MRVFLAIEIPEGIKKDLVRIQRELAPQVVGVRWEKAEKLHLTLVFLGEVSEGRIKDLEGAVQKGVESAQLFEVGLSGVRAFPNEKRPRVVLVEVGEGREEIVGLQKSLAEALSEAGFDFARLSMPHVTLGRFKRGAKHTRRVCKKIEDGTGFEVKEVVVVESKLYPAGAIHTPIARVPL